MPVANTSKMAYDIIRFELSDRQALVYNFLNDNDKENGYTNSEISAAIMLPINSVTPRMNELRAMGRVKPAGQRKCQETGFTAKAWRVNDQPRFC